MKKLSNTFFSFFDKNKFVGGFKVTSVIICLILILSVVGVVYSKYESNISVYSEAKVAYFVTEQGTISDSITLTDLVPSDGVYIYPINVYNYDKQKRTDVNLKYTIEFETTTNIPIELDVMLNEVYSDDYTSIVTSSEYIQDGDVYYKKYVDSTEYTFNYDENQMNQYTLIIRFPLEYKNYPDLYQGKIELIKVTIKAEQLV